MCYNNNGDYMQINKIVKMKNNKYKIYFDDDIIITYDNVILDNDLLYKKNIDNEIYKKIVCDTNYYDIYNKVVKYILKRRRSEREVLLYLNKFETNENDKGKIIDKLKEINLINDDEYCRAYINDKLYLSKDGINKIKSNLLKENISISTIESELNNVDKDIFDERLEKLIIKKIKSNNKYSNSYLKQKILNDMVNLGYDKNKVLSIIECNIMNDNNVLNKEFNRVYDKLKVKYKDNELNNKVKQKLIQKGFKIDSINNLLNKKTEE